MCLVLIMRMQSAVRASLARMASFRSSVSWASMDMGLLAGGGEARPKITASQRPPVNLGHRAETGAGDDTIRSGGPETTGWRGRCFGSIGNEDGAHDAQPQGVRN